MVAMTLIRIFPRIYYIEYVDENWGKVMDAVCLSRQIVGCSSKEYPLLHPEVTLMIPPQEPHSRAVASRETIRSDTVLHSPQ